MKTYSALVLACLCLFLAGCGTTGSDLKSSVLEKFSGSAYRTKIVSADSRAAYEAVRQSATKLGFRFVSGGAAQGRLVALSGLLSGDSLKSARQLSMTVKLAPLAAGGTEVAVMITEQVEDDFNKGAGQATATVLRDTPLYDVFFRNVEQMLAAK